MMGFKFQLLRCGSPQELLQVTLNHLCDLRAKIEDARPIVALMDDAIRTAEHKYGGMSCAEWFMLKQARSQGEQQTRAADEQTTANEQTSAANERSRQEEEGEGGAPKVSLLQERKKPEEEAPPSGRRSAVSSSSGR